jgi:hypothetical protein
LMVIGGFKDRTVSEKNGKG